MDKKPIPYEKTVFVCTHARADGRVSCGNPGRGGVEHEFSVVQPGQIVDDGQSQS